MAVPPFPPGTHQWMTFLPFISQKILLNIKDVAFDFRLGCILVKFAVFMNNKRAMYKSRILEFSIILFSKLAILAFFDAK